MLARALRAIRLLLLGCSRSRRLLVSFHAHVLQNMLLVRTENFDKVVVELWLILLECCEMIEDQ